MNSTPNTSHKIEDVLNALKKDYTLIGKRHIKAWQAWLIVGVVAGAIGAVALVANRSGEVENTRAVGYTSSPLVRYVSERRPLRGSLQELFAERPAKSIFLPLSGGTISGAGSNNSNSVWRRQAVLPDTVIKDIVFPTAEIGYVAAELGKVWKTTDAGEHWTKIMDAGFPYFWYGVDALDADQVVISGFVNSTVPGGNLGVIRWSKDGGKTWTPDRVLTRGAWLGRIRFVDKTHGISVEKSINEASDHMHYTTNGGQNADDWIRVMPTDKEGWFGNQLSFLPNLKVRVSGINYCTSSNGGASWGCRSSVDEVFDGAVFYLNDISGWVGGGTISPEVMGWVHRTEDGGNTWSGRTLISPWPIRELHFVTSLSGWAVGGDLYSGVGGIYVTHDGGLTWTLDINTGAEMAACDNKEIPSPDPGRRNWQIWCAGFTPSFDGVIYRRSFATTSPSVEKKIFLSSATYTGNLGGLAGADAKCQSLASAAGLSGTFKAWLSDSVTSAASRLTHAIVPYKLVSGTSIANNWNDLVDGSLPSSIGVTEQGQPINANIWTNTKADGTLRENKRIKTCEDWTRETGFNYVGYFGQSKQTDTRWTDSGSQTWCTANLMRLYCMEQ